MATTTNSNNRIPMDSQVDTNPTVGAGSPAPVQAPPATAGFVQVVIPAKSNSASGEKNKNTK